MSEFKFKQFSISQVKTAAKIGTDAVLLGAWTPIPQACKSILDIGAGTGVISLMLAQRNSNAKIIGVEINSEASDECKFNFEKSPWTKRLECFNVDFRNTKFDSDFDLIISNPPFFTENTLAPKFERSLARNVMGLSFQDLIQKSSEILNNQGVFSVILPYKEVQLFCEIARENKLFPYKITHVQGHQHSPFKRSLIAFSKEKQQVVTSNLCIEIQRHQYTQEYIQLTKDFYLKM